MKGLIQEGEIVDEMWSKKKIAVAVIIVAVLGGILYQMRPLYLDKLQVLTSRTSVKGASTTNTLDTNNNQQTQTFSLPSSSNVSQKFQQIQQEIKSMSLSEVASSSPQVKKVLQDIQDLKNVPATQAKDACEKICSNL